MFAATGQGADARRRVVGPVSEAADSEPTGRRRAGADVARLLSDRRPPARAEPACSILLAMGVLVAHPGAAGPVRLAT